MVGVSTRRPVGVAGLSGMDPLHATLEEIAAEGYTFIEANCPRCRVTRLRPIDQLPKISMGLTLDGLARYRVPPAVERSAVPRLPNSARAASSQTCRLLGRRLKSLVMLKPLVV
jgi:hypothetical protein